MLEFAFELFAKSTENHEISGKSVPTSFQNQPKAVPKSMKMIPWTVLGAKSRPGRLKVARCNSGSRVFGEFSVENGAPRVDFGTPGKPKIGPKPHFCG